ncbi:MarR family transcriptional regulator [Corallococcus sp. CA049B]|uniref:MarR family winged helix-turn-helix transcriptional regulator n=1 Tax=Corallococcus TaxID=83461 RepID=UPI000EA136BD|nr:MarR family winged helix-turn-helix transcriptional regulator [Corallococcus sp. CA049B]NOJ92422.1 winged helix-turn-helix transcriptional regulator [Corallococcus coralloides]RKG83233.1 MarR family transcriptional regulator [Corallococcus sp. CA049B]
MSQDDLQRTLCNCLALRQASRHVTQFYDQVLAPSGIRTTQYSILHRVQTQGPLTVNALAEQLVMDPSTLTHNLKPLLKDGFVVLEVGRTDRRQRAIAITPEGQGVYRKARPLWLRAQADFERAVGDTQASALRDLLAAVSRTGLGEPEAAAEAPPVPKGKARRSGR